MFHWRSYMLKSKLFCAIATIAVLYSTWYLTGKNVEIIMMSRISFTEENGEFESEIIVQQVKSNTSIRNAAKMVRICTQDERKFYVKQMCSKLHPNHMDYSKSTCWKAVNSDMQGAGPCMLVDHVNKVVFCEITKSGSSTGIATMMNYGPHGAQAPQKYYKGQVHSPDLKNKLGLVQEVYTYKLENYTKFMIVRHPFDRLLSSYTDKMRMVDKTGRFKTLRLEVKAKYGNLDWNALEGYEFSEIPDVNVTFQEFVSMLKDPNPGLSLQDEHWEPTGLLCDPCRVHYDYIMRTESLHYDAAEFIRNVYNKIADVPEINVNRKINKSPQQTISTKLLKQYFETLSKGDLQMLWQKYINDFQIYGYEFDAKTLEASCKVDTGDGDICC